MFLKNPTRNNSKIYVNIYIIFRRESFSKHNNKQTLETDEKERFGGEVGGIKQALGQPPGIFDLSLDSSPPHLSPSVAPLSPKPWAPFWALCLAHPTVVSTPSR